MIRAEVERERFVEAMGVMARLRGPVDAFFDKVKVNDDDPKVRENRLKLLSRAARDAASGRGFFEDRGVGLPLFTMAALEAATQRARVCGRG